MDDAKAREFDEIATNVFAPIYPMIARQALERTGICAGTALDVGCGPGLLAIAIAEQSAMKVFSLDSSPWMLQVAYGHIVRAGMVRRVLPVLGDVHELPFEEGSIDLVVSRGSWFFWDDLGRAFQEIHRVLAPGRKAYIGGGFGNALLKEEIVAIMRARSPDWDKGVEERTRKNNPDRVRAELSRAGITLYRLLQDESGFWAIIEKEGSKK